MVIKAPETTSAQRKSSLAGFVKRKVQQLIAYYNTEFYPDNVRPLIYNLNRGRRLISVTRRFLRSKQRQKQYPDIISELKQDNQGLKRQSSDLAQTLYFTEQELTSLDRSIRASEARLASNHIGYLERIIQQLREDLATSTECEMHLGQLYGASFQENEKLKVTLTANVRSSLASHEELAQLRANEMHLEAIAEDNKRTTVKKVLCINFLENTIHQGEQRFVEQYVPKIAEFLSKHPGEVILIGPGFGGTIEWASPAAREILHYNGQLKGMRYLDALALNPSDRRRAAVLFANPEPQTIFVPVLYGNGKQEVCRVSSYPIISRESKGKPKHLGTIATISSLSWLEKRRARHSQDNLQYRLQEYLKARHENHPI